MAHWVVGGLLHQKKHTHNFQGTNYTFNSTMSLFATFRPPIRCRFTTDSLPTLRMKIPPVTINPDTLSPTQRPTVTPLFHDEYTSRCGPRQLSRYSDQLRAGRSSVRTLRRTRCRFVCRKFGTTERALEQRLSEVWRQLWASHGTWVPRQLGNGKRKL